MITRRQKLDEEAADEIPPEYNHPQINFGYDDDSKYKDMKHRLITNWSIKNKKGKVVELPLPRRGFHNKLFNQRDRNELVLCGELLPTRSIDTETEKQNLKKDIHELKSWVFDSSPFQRGFWILTNDNVWYWLLKPSLEQEKVHKRHRALCGILSNFLDLLSGKDGGAGGSPIGIYKDLNPVYLHRELCVIANEQPFDLDLFRLEADFIRAELKSMNLENMNQDCAFLKGFLRVAHKEQRKNLKERFEEGEYEISASEAERRSNRFSWGGFGSVNWVNPYHKHNEKYLENENQQSESTDEDSFFYDLEDLGDASDLDLSCDSKPDVTDDASESLDDIDDEDWTGQAEEEEEEKAPRRCSNKRKRASKQGRNVAVDRSGEESLQRSCSQTSKPTATSFDENSGSLSGDNNIEKDLHSLASFSVDDLFGAGLLSGSVPGGKKLLIQNYSSSSTSSSSSPDVDEEQEQEQERVDENRKRKSPDIPVVSPRVSLPHPPAEIHVTANHRNNILSRTPNFSLDEKTYSVIFAKLGDTSGLEETVLIDDGLGLTVDSPMKDIMKHGEIESVFGIDEIDKCRFHIETNNVDRKYIQHSYNSFQRMTIMNLKRQVSSSSKSEKDHDRKMFCVHIKF